MNIQEIRRRTSFVENSRVNSKLALQSWAFQLSQGFQFAVTLTIKRSFRILNDRGSHIHVLKREDCDAIASRFKLKLNREVFGKASERYNKSLKFLPVVEGGANGKNLHFHMAIGNYPFFLPLNRFPIMVINAIDKVYELDFEHEVKIMDSGWIDYFIKDSGQNNSDDILWNLM